MTVRKAKPNDVPYRLKDENGLFMEVLPSGKKVWRMRYWIHQKEGLLKLGEYPMMTLKEAREKRDDVRRQVSNGQKPTAFGQKQQEDVEPEKKRTFSVISGEWFALRRQGKNDPKTIGRDESRIRRLVIPHVGDMEMDEITPPVLLNVFRKIEGNGTVETAHRTRNICSQIFRSAIIIGDASRDTTSDLKGMLIPSVENHFATITDSKEIGALLRACEGYEGSEVVRVALLLLPMVFVRPGELRRMEWGEIDIDNARWNIPKEKMKMKRPHIVPLSAQALTLLENLRKLTGRGRYAFPSIRTPAGNAPMSDNTINAALRRMGYSRDEMTGHGFSAMASTLLYEHEWPSEVIEIQLANQEHNKVKAAYNHAQYLSKRREMMQWWADYLENLKKSASK